MPNFSNSKIYRLVNDQIPGTCYVGSTTQPLSHRYARHKSSFKHGYPISSAQLFMIGTPKIELLEEFPCNTNKELLVRERYYIENNNCVNACLPGRTQKEYNNRYREANRIYAKQYRKDNHAAILIWKKTKKMCTCGKMVMNVGLARHKRCTYHIANHKDSADQTDADVVI